MSQEEREALQKIRSESQALRDAASKVSDPAMAVLIDLVIEKANLLIARSD